MTYHVQFPGLGLEFTLDRVAFTVFGMPIYWYGILIATGLALAIVFAFSHARRFGIDSDRMVDVILIGTVCAVIGGRAFYVATAPFEYASFAEMLDIRLGGVAIYGAVIAAFLSGYFACRWRKVPILPMFDLAGMGFLLGQGIGRWGNFVNQEAFGTNTTLPWGMYSEGTCNYLSSVQETLAAQGVAVDPSLPVHPTFLYESIWCLLGFFLLWAYMKRRKFHGVLVQLPLPGHIREKRVIDAISPDKDVDGFTPVNVGRMVIGEECFLPCTPAGCIEMLKSTGVPIAGKDAVVIGRSNIVGKPAALLLTANNATVTLCHSKTRDLKAKCAAADIIVAAIGKAGFVTADMVKEGAVVIDVGINRNAEGKLCGDVDFAPVAEKAAYITPVPGGVGLMTRAMLMKNTVKAARLQSGL